MQKEKIDNVLRSERTLPQVPFIRSESRDIGKKPLAYTRNKNPMGSGENAYQSGVDMYGLYPFCCSTLFRGNEVTALAISRQRASNALLMAPTSAS